MIHIEFNRNLNKNKRLNQGIEISEFFILFDSGVLLILVKSFLKI
jgi:hypothetical protein